MMRVRLPVLLVAALVVLGFGGPAAAGGWDESNAASGAIHVPTAVYVPTPPRVQRCRRDFHPGCRVHSFVVYRYGGTGYPRYHYRWRGYGWNR
jgi:hypothetical protein